MQMKNLIQASANVIKIVNLKIGDVVKQVETSGYSNDGVYFAVVTDILNNGEEAFVQLTRYKKEYRSIDCDIKTYSGKSDLNIFPATVEEVKEHLAEAIYRIEKDLKEEQIKLDNKRVSLDRARDFVSMETSRKLTEVSFREMPQVEYNKIKQENSF